MHFVNFLFHDGRSHPLPATFLRFCIRFITMRLDISLAFKTVRFRFSLRTCLFFGLIFVRFSGTEILVPFKYLHVDIDDTAISLHLGTHLRCSRLHCVCAPEQNHCISARRQYRCVTGRSASGLFSCVSCVAFRAGTTCTIPARLFASRVSCRHYLGKSRRVSRLVVLPVFRYSLRCRRYVLTLSRISAISSTAFGCSYQTPLEYSIKPLRLVSRNNDFFAIRQRHSPPAMEEYSAASRCFCFRFTQKKNISGG